jgi:hypothetical protein
MSLAFYHEERHALVEAIREAVQIRDCVRLYNTLCKWDSIHV